jgi:uncharacterized protein YjbI with pentapeptide repeats
MEDKEFQDIIAQHQEWLKTKGKSGKRADFTRYSGHEYWTFDNRRIIIGSPLINLDGKKLRNLDLSEAILSGMSLRNVDLSGTNLFKADLRGVKLTNSNLSDALLQDAKLYGADLNNVVVLNTNFEKANFDNAQLLNVNLSNSLIRGAKFNWAKLKGACLDRLDLRDMEFENSDLSDATLINANLSSAEFKRAILARAKMNRSILDRAKFESASLVSASLISAKIRDSNFAQADLDGANLENADLRGSTFQRATLRNARLKNADLTAVRLQGANLEGADLSVAVLHYANLDDFIDTEDEGDRLHDEESGNTKIYFTDIRGVNWEGAEATSINISSTAISFLPKHIKDTFNIAGQNTIIRSIEFSSELREAGTSILMYFNHILKLKYPDIRVNVRIEQDDLILRMIIHTPNGYKGSIEVTLQEYGMVVIGKMPAELFLNDPLEIMALKNKLEIAHLELRQTRELLEFAKKDNQRRIESLGMVYPICSG